MSRQEDPSCNGPGNSTAKSDPGERGIVLEGASSRARGFGPHGHALIDGGVKLRDGRGSWGEEGVCCNGDAPPRLRVLLGPRKGLLW